MEATEGGASGTELDPPILRQCTKKAPTDIAGPATMPWLSEEGGGDGKRAAPTGAYSSRALRA